MTEKQKILRSTGLVSFLTIVSRLFGYMRDLGVAILLGTSVAADAFVLAFRIPNLLRRLTAEGALTGAFVPVFTQYRARQPAEAWEFANTMFWTLAAAMASVTALGMLFAPALVRGFTFLSPEPEPWALAVQLTRIMFPYCLLIALTALASAALNTLRVFGLPAATTIFLNTAIIVAAAVAYFGRVVEPTVVLAVGVVAGGVLQLLVQVPALVRRGMEFNFRVSLSHPGVRRVLTLMLPAVAGVGIYQINVLVSTVFASKGTGWIAALYYADRVMEVALGVFAISVATVILPVLSQQAAAQDLGGMKQTLGFAFRQVGFIVVPASVGLMVLHEPIIRVLFQHAAFGSQSTALTAQALVFYALGLPAFAAVRLVVPAYYAQQDTATPVRLAGTALLVNILLCAALVGPLAQRGLALATSLASYLNFFGLYVILRRRIGPVEERAVARSLVRTGLASAGMGLVCWGASHGLSLAAAGSFPVLALRFGLTLAAGLGSYLLFVGLLGAEELREIRTLFARRVEGPRAAEAGATLAAEVRNK